MKKLSIKQVLSKMLKSKKYSVVFHSNSTLIFHQGEFDFFLRIACKIIKNAKLALLKQLHFCPWHIILQPKNQNPFFNIKVELPWLSSCWTVFV